MVIPLHVSTQNIWKEVEKYVGGVPTKPTKVLGCSFTVHAGEQDKNLQAPFEPLSLCKISSTII